MWEGQVEGRYQPYTNYQKENDMRRSHEGLSANFTKKDDYSGLPEELKEFNYYYLDGGHVVMAIPKCLLDEAQLSK